MAKLSAHGTELFRYLSLKHRGLLAVMSDGTVLRKTPWQPTWKLYRTKKKEVSIEAWTASKMEMKAKLEGWQFVKSIPSAAKLEAWALDSVCEAVDGSTVEPDGKTFDGCPSWLLVFGAI